MSRPIIVFAFSDHSAPESVKLATFTELKFSLTNCIIKSHLVGYSHATKMQTDLVIQYNTIQYNTIDLWYRPSSRTCQAQKCTFTHRRCRCNCNAEHCRRGICSRSIRGGQSGIRTCDPPDGRRRTLPLSYHAAQMLYLILLPPSAFWFLWMCSAITHQHSG